MARKVYTPRPFAPLITKHIEEHERCALWLPMGFGKTITTVTPLINLDLMEDIWPALILGPKRVARDVWPKEMDKWEHTADYNVVPIIGDREERLAALRRDAPMHSINYENLEWLVKEVPPEKWPWKTLIADEATKLKNFKGSDQVSKKGKQFVRGGGSMRARALAKVAYKMRRIIELTGTPAPNGLKDLWGQLWFLDHGQRLGRIHGDFMARYFSKGYDGFSVIPNNYAAEQIHEAVKDICLSLKVEDWFDVRDPIVNDVYVDLPPSVRDAYDQMERKMYTEILDRKVEVFNAAARTSKLLQLANGAVYVDPDVENDEDPRSKIWRPVHDRKLEALDSVVTEAGGAPMIVSYEFRSDKARILKAFPGSVDLSTQAGEREFRTGRVAVGLANPDSLAHGVDGLQDVCNRITFFGQGWNLELYDQIIGRIGAVRQLQAGLDRPIFITHILARDTQDENVMERRITKRETQDILMEAAKRRLGR